MRKGSHRNRCIRKETISSSRKPNVRKGGGTVNNADKRTLPSEVEQINTT